MKNSPITIVVAFAFLMLQTGCTTPFKIDRGRVEDLWGLKITNELYYQKEMPFRPIDIQPNTFFALSSLGLKDNSPHTVSEVCNPSGYKSLYHTYSVEIQNPENKRKYYGRIAFFQANAGASVKAVTSYYRISFPAGKFEEATDGRIAFYYEYYDNFPTWILWVSDVPLK